MADEMKGGRRLSGNRPSSPSNDFSVEEALNFVRSSTVTSPSAAASPKVDDSLVDEILRSISDQSETPVPQATRRTPVTPPQGDSASPASNYYRTPSNSYEAAARNYQAPVQNTPPKAAPKAAGHHTTGPLPDPGYYAMRDPSQTQSFQPARPTQRNTDRLPTIVEEKPKPKNTVVGKILTFIVAILVIVALVLGVKMLYILAPSLGLDLPDLTKLPGISTLVDMLPDEEPADLEEQIPEDVTPDVEEEPVPDVPVQIPTSVTLDFEEITLDENQSVIVTASLDVEGWDGDIAWATNDKNVATVTELDNYTAQVTWVGEGRCWLAAVVSVPTDNDSDRPSVTCSIVCNAPAVVEAPEVEEPVEEAPPAEHVEISLNTYRNSGEFSLTVGAVHTLLDEPNDKITFSSAHESVATVAADGTVKAKGAGTCTITATDPDGCKVEAICRVTW